MDMLRRRQMKPFGLLLSSVFLGTVGQLCSKKGLTDIGPLYLDLAPSKVVGIVLKIFSNPLVLVGVFSYLLGSIIWLVVLSRTELSFAYPFVSLTYLLVFIGSWYLFGESISFLRCLGLGLILCGVIFISLS